MMLLDTVLQVSATMIIGVLFIVTIAQALKVEDWAMGRWLFIFCVFGIIPFTVTAVLALLELAEVAKWACIISFIIFCVALSIISLLIATGSKPFE